MSKAERTRAFIIEQSAPVFNRKGYAATSLSDIMEVTGLTKGAVYGNFADKEEVAVAVYHYHINNLIRKLDDAMSGHDTRAEQLMAFTTFYRKNWKKIFERGGCPLQNASVEADDNLDYLKPHVQQTVRSWVKGFARIIQRGQEQGEFRKKIDPEEYACLMISMMEGGIMMGKTMGNHKYLFAVLDRIDKIIREELSK